MAPSQKKGGKSDKEEGYNALEKHVAFFDRNGDGVVYPWETYKGFRAIGLGRLPSAIAGLFINMGLSKKTRPGKGFSPLFPIEVKNSRFLIHGSHTDVYDKDGRFVESKFEEIFDKHARKHRNALTNKEVLGMLKANRDPKDFGGWFTLASFGTFFGSQHNVMCVALTQCPKTCSDSLSLKLMMSSIDYYNTIITCKNLYFNFSDLLVAKDLEFKSLVKNPHLANMCKN